MPQALEIIEVKKEDEKSREIWRQIMSEIYTKASDDDFSRCI